MIKDKKKKRKEKERIPKTVQQSIPYVAVYPDSGIIEVKPGMFSRSYLLQDINYSVAKEETQVEVFRKYGQMLNSLDSSYNVQITINNKNIDKKDFEKTVLLKRKGDDFDKYRSEYNKMLTSKIKEGKNVAKEIYFTLSLEAEDYETASRLFARLDTEIPANFKAIENCLAQPLDTLDRMRILHNIYNVNHEEDFDLRTVLNGHRTTNFNWKAMSKQGITTKDIMARQKKLCKSRQAEVKKTGANQGIGCVGHSLA